MFIDLGYVKQYNAEKGTGKISRFLSGSDSESCRISFSKKNIDDNELLSQIKTKSLFGLMVWYTFEIKDSIGYAINLWPRCDRMPTTIREMFAAEIEKVWVDIERPVSYLLESYTMSLGGYDLVWTCKEARENAIRQRNRKTEVDEGYNSQANRSGHSPIHSPIERSQIIGQTETNAQVASATNHPVIEHPRINNDRSIVILEDKSHMIREFCEAHCITTLIHFTHICNLKGILERGLQSRRQLEELPETSQPLFNDPLRLDEYRSGICLSISFPNYKMFYKLHQNRTMDWAVTLLDASILWEMDCAFNSTNAASNIMRSIPIHKRKKVEAFANMFSDLQNIRTQLNIPDPFPTDPQAEVLVFEPISPRYIKGVHFSSFQIKLEWQNKFSHLGPDFFHCADQFFNPRWDYRYWT